MDLAKAMAYFGKGDYTLVAIPTTSGSGSEVTDFAILTHEQVKHPLVDKRLRPDLAILDSDLLQQLPQNLIAETGFDVLTHALEAYVASDSGSISDLYAREAFSSAYASLPASYAGNQNVRLKVHIAATMAGMAFSQAGLGLCHAMAHSLGGMFHVPHGRLNAILIPSIVSCNAHVCGKKYAELARAAGMGGSADTIAVQNLRNGLVRLRRELNLPETLSQAGVDPRAVWRNVNELVEVTLEDPCCKANPMVVEGFLVRRILEEVTGRV
jgi:alcohol dehydrogenase class IV